MKDNQLSTKVWQDPVYFIAFGFGSGLAPVAPGTWGTLAAIPVYLILVQHSLSVYLTISIIFFLAGIWLTNKVTNDLGIEDYSGIVWDEIVGYLFTMLNAPKGIGWVVLGFLLFRLFDIWKPYPIKLVDKKLKGGLGIMLDDLLAAIPAWLIVQALAWLVK